MKVNNIVKPRKDQGWRLELEFESLEAVIAFIGALDPQWTRPTLESTQTAILEDV